jgi:PAS domain S-box-containing protein
MSPATGLLFIANGGEMGAYMRAHDWAKTPLGPPDCWPQILKTAVRLLLNSGHPMYIYWGQPGYCFYNDAYRQSIGSERHPGSLGRPAQEVWSEIWDIIGPQIDHVMAGRGATWHENALVPITRDGRREDVYWTYSFGPLDDEGAQNGVGGVLVVCTETTRTVLAGRQRASEVERLRRVFEHAPGFICMLRGPKHIYEFVNQSHRKLFNSDDWVGKPIRQAFPDLAGQGFYELMDQVYATGERFVATAAEVRFRGARTGPEQVVLLDFVYAPLVDEGGVVTGIFCEGFDVTERYRVQQALRESEEQLRLATDAAEVGFWDVDVRTDTLFWPPRVKAMFGISPNASVSMADFYAGLHPDDRERISAAYAAAADPEIRALYDVEYRTVGKEDGVVRCVAAKGRGVFDPRGSCLRVIGTAIDITQRRAIDERLRDLNATLERRVEAQTAERIKAEEHLRQAQKIEAIGQLTGGVAHDFNNLLMVVAGGLSLLERDPAPEKRQRIIEGMRQATERGAGLSRQLLAFARRKPLSAEPVDLARQLGRMRELLDRTLRGDVQVTTDFPDGLWPINVDPGEFELVLLNLSVNARDAMPGGGTITIRAENMAAASVGGVAGDFVRLTIADTGIGMSPEIRAKAFEPFFTTKEIGKGSGLGLPQVYGFATQSGGTVAIDSTVGQGTTITLVLPRSANTPNPVDGSIDATKTPPMSTIRCGSILLVEDDNEVGKRPVLAV